MFCFKQCLIVECLFHTRRGRNNAFIKHQSVLFGARLNAQFFGGWVSCEKMGRHTNNAVMPVDDNFDAASVKSSLHTVYVSGPDSFDPSRMHCYCNKSLILALSKSVKNKYCLYFKSPKGQCSFFQWGDLTPAGKVLHWLQQGVNPEARGKEQRHKPYDLARPMPRQRNFEARTRR